MEFADNTWKERMCTECVAELGHCPMHFYEPDKEDVIYSKQRRRFGAEDDDQPYDICLCHDEYNHCVAPNPSGILAEIDPEKPLETFDPNVALNRALASARVAQTTTTTTQAPEAAQAMGYGVCFWQ